jgi:hypothetical protein
MADLIQGGVGSDRIEQEMLFKGFDTQRIQTVLESDQDMKADVMELMKGLAQKEMIESLSAMNEDDVKGNGKNADAFGNRAKGPDKEIKNKPGRGNNPSKEVGATRPNFGGPSEGPQSGSAKPDRNNHNNRRLSAMPDGVSRMPCNARFVDVLVCLANDIVFLSLSAT